ncbi:MAG: HEAT repeat domain-containing protein [Verrucomicrobia bacterium]|nr:MAG: HEAT repeat domain-containing protein [Verrucomicrobiota bacterium]
MKDDVHTGVPSMPLRGPEAASVPFFIDRDPVNRRHPAVISPVECARRAFLCAVLSLGILGCGKDGDAPKKVDVAAQVAALKGTGDAKATALSELAAGGPNSAAAINDIVPLLKDADPLTRRLAAYALGQIGPAAKAAVPNLTPLLQDQDRSVITAALNAIRAIDPSKAPAENIPNTMN